MHLLIGNISSDLDEIVFQDKVYLWEWIYIIDVFKTSSDTYS